MKNFKLTHLLIFLLLIFIGLRSNAQSDEDCMMCHEDKSLSEMRQGKNVSLFVNLKTINTSVHKKVRCISCHEGAAVSDFPHSENLAPVNCGKCHSTASRSFYSGIHGQAFRRNEPYAPSCKECHGQHDILPSSNEKSKTYKMNIPILCGSCHKEGSPVTRVYNIPEHNIIENYSEGIHGKGLYKSGLIVTATCNDCHGNHQVLPHTNQFSTVAPGNIAKTCMKCHTRIEDVHKKIINQKLWRENPNVIPSCSNCHPPHITKIYDVAGTMSNQSCLKCHAKDDIFKIVDGKKKSMKVNIHDINDNAHKDINCVKCHTEMHADEEKPCRDAKKVDCSNCHYEVANQYYDSEHGKAFSNKRTNAPYCTDCHGTHIIKSKSDDKSPIYRSQIPNLCGSCHKKNGKADIGSNLNSENSLPDYSSSVHGRGLSEKGLLVSAICTDCHTSHNELKASDERSSINPKNIPATCASCHKGIYDEYMQSDHTINHAGKNKYPTCVDCHSAHVITEVDKDKFMYEVTDQCGTCHKELAETYLDTYHGQAYKLGYEKSARCTDCHGAHKILNMNNPESSVGPNNIVNTCKKCHIDANKKFTGYLTHATHYNRNKFPLLYYTYWGMTSLLISVFIFFGIHTLLWIPRSYRERKKKIHVKIEGKAKYYRRFTTSQRITHVFVIISFLLLAATGMTLKFSHMEWAKVLAKFFGGVSGAGTLHRFGAIITFGYFGFHIYSLFKMMKYKKISLKRLIFGSDSLWFNKQDLVDFIATVKWFVGKGPRPQYGRWTYWEKFDYLAVFWGVAVIGFTGLMLWIPETFSIILPGKFINVAQIIHSDEALLAVGFIFTIHFFNTHLRPESFPMDTVIFTGHVPIEEYKEDRPKEYKEMEEAGVIESKIFEQEFSETRMRLFKFFGFLFLSIGVILVALIIYSLLKG